MLIVVKRQLEFSDADHLGFYNFQVDLYFGSSIYFKLPVERIKYGTLPQMKTAAKPVLLVAFYVSASGDEPVRTWLKSLPAHERLAIGEDIKAVQFRWPLDMPLVRKLTGKLWEVRTQLPTRIARVLFTVNGNQMVLLHGFIKKTQATPAQDMALAMSRIDF